MNNIVSTPLRWATIDQLTTTEPYSRLYSRSGWRHLVFNANPVIDVRGRILVPGNGLGEAGVIVKVGRRLFLDLDRLDVWLASHRVIVQPVTRD